MRDAWYSLMYCVVLELFSIEWVVVIILICKNPRVGWGGGSLQYHTGMYKCVGIWPEPKFFSSIFLMQLSASVHTFFIRNCLTRSRPSTLFLVKYRQGKRPFCNYFLYLYIFFFSCPTKSAVRPFWKYQPTGYCLSYKSMILRNLCNSGGRGWLSRRLLLIKKKCFQYCTKVVKLSVHAFFIRN